MISRVRRLIYDWYTQRPHLGCIRWLIGIKQVSVHIEV
jgi:hypothetical protein